MKTANNGVFRFLTGGSAATTDKPAVTRPDDPNRNYYMGAGAHPEIVERLWDQLGKGLPSDTRALVFGVPALVHPGAGVVLAFALGTEYAMRLPRVVWMDCPPTGLRIVTNWTGGGSTDIQRECGKEWIFGSFDEAEVAWCRQAFDECAREPGQ